MKKWGQAELRDFIDPEEAGDKEVGGRLGDRRDVFVLTEDLAGTGAI